MGVCRLFTCRKTGDITHSPGMESQFKEATTVIQMQLWMNNLHPKLEQEWFLIIIMIDEMGRARPLPSTLAEYLKINLSEEQYFIKVFKKYWSGHF